MYLLIDDIVEAVDFPAALLALIAYDKLKNGDEKPLNIIFQKLRQIDIQKMY